MQVYINIYGMLHLFFVEQESPEETTEEREYEKEDTLKKHKDDCRFLQVLQMKIPQY
jgi:hypothetical protein